jgi:hypothetical protein
MGMNLGTVWGVQVLAALVVIMSSGPRILHCCKSSYGELAGLTRKPTVLRRSIFFFSLFNLDVGRPHGCVPSYGR